jgi:hypothetical protein
VKTLEQIRQEAASYAIREASKALDKSEKVHAMPLPHLLERLAIERLLELAFLAGVNAARDGVL